MKRSRRALWALLATLAAALLSVDLSTRRDEVPRRPPAAARSADKRSGARRRVVSGSLARLARDPSHSTGVALVRWLNQSGLSGSPRPGDYVSLAADARHSTGAALVERLNHEEDNVDTIGAWGPQLFAATGQHLDVAPRGWSGCSAFACGCDHLGRKPDSHEAAGDAIARRGWATDGLGER